MNGRLEARKAVSGRTARRAWLGRQDEENVHLVLTHSGDVIKARTVRPNVETTLQGVAVWTKLLPTVGVL